uniref:Putative secreted peptide n=1 Tax=Anopheles braziliensis TaxID=58242 RepID=A0A2M3ZSG8_9DIPT
MRKALAVIIAAALATPPSPSPASLFPACPSSRPSLPPPPSNRSSIRCHRRRNRKKRCTKFRRLRSIRKRNSAVWSRR